MFKLGDKVKWIDEQGGRKKEKHGTVVEVVAPYRRPNRNRFPALYTKTKGFGFGQEHESYVVRAQMLNYWPAIYNLQKDE